MNKEKFKVVNYFTNSFKGFEGIINGLKIFSKMSIYIFILLFIIQIVFMVVLVKYNSDFLFRISNSNTKKVYSMDQKDYCLINTYIRGYLQKVYPTENFFKKDYVISYTCDGVQQQVYYNQFRQTFDSYLINVIVKNILNNLLRLFLITCSIYPLYFLIVYLLSKKHEKDSEEKYIRGARYLPQEKMKKLLDNFDDSYKYRINKYISLPESLFSRNNLIIGKKGSGKSQLLMPIIEQIIKRNKKAIIHDYKGDIIPYFYNSQEHYIFNPLDKRHMGNDDKDDKIKGWTLFNELKTYPDIDAFVSSSVPETKNSDPIFHVAPRDLLKSFILYCIKNKKTTNKDLYDLIMEPPERMIELMSSFPEGKIALKHLEEPKLAGQYNSVIAAFTSHLFYLKDTDGNFSIGDWIRDENPKKKIIFVSNQSKVSSTLRPLITTFFDFSIKEICSLPENLKRVIHIILEEFGRLEKMDSIVEGLTEARSKGGAITVITQDYGQIANKYGNDLTETIINGCGNHFYFSVKDHSTAEKISKTIGPVEVRRTKESKSFGVENLRDSFSVNDEVSEKRLILSSEIMQQKTNFSHMDAYVQITDMPLTQITLTGKGYTLHAEPFIPCDFLKINCGTTTDSNEDNSNANEQAQEFVTGMKNVAGEPEMEISDDGNNVIIPESSFYGEEKNEEQDTIKDKKAVDLHKEMLKIALAGEDDE